jgi:disulfide bond formation protein DsbB
MRRIGSLLRLDRAKRKPRHRSQQPLARRTEPGHIAGMTMPGSRSVALLSALAAGFALGLALASERWGGLVPCALCLLERWPYRVAIVLSLIAFVLPRRFARMLLLLVVLSMLAAAALAVVHVGVEQHYWPSPLPECAAPRLSGGSIAERLAQMPARPGKPCEDPTFLVPGLPISMAAMNLLYAVLFVVLLGVYLWRDWRSAR